MSDANDRTAPSRVIASLISPRLTVICIACLMVLTFWGTVYQVENGLYAAQQRFYNSYFMLLGGVVPFPGTQLVLTVLLVNLLGYLVKMLMYDRLKPGIVMTHLGILMLLAGGAITHNFAEESHLTLLEGEGSNVSASYYNWELALWKENGDQREVWATDADNLKSGDVLNFPDLQISVDVEEYYRNARAFQSSDKGGDVQSRMGITSLEPAPFEKEPGDNMAAGVFNVRSAGGTATKILLYGEDMFAGPMAAGGGVVVALRHRRYPLPVFVTLQDFKREMHPGTDMARSFSSKVAVESVGVQRTMTISMNKPLRHHGYTLYQASYAELPNGMEQSTFAVARNYGRLVPYIATSVVVLGMIVHFVSMLIGRAMKREAAA